MLHACIPIIAIIHHNAIIAARLILARGAIIISSPALPIGLLKPSHSRVGMHVYQV